MLEDPHNPSATITVFSAHFCFLLGGILRPRKGLLTDLSCPIVSPEPPAQPDSDCSCSSQARSSVAVMFTRSLNSLVRLSAVFVYSASQGGSTQSRCLCPSLFPPWNFPMRTVGSDEWRAASIGLLWVYRLETSKVQFDVTAVEAHRESPGSIPRLLCHDDKVPRSSSINQSSINLL